MRRSSLASYLELSCGQHGQGGWGVKLHHSEYVCALLHLRKQQLNRHTRLQTPVNTTQPAIPMESHPSPTLADERKRDSAWVRTIHLHLQYSGSTSPGERTCSTMTWASSLAMFSSTCLREHLLAAAFSRIWASYFTFSSPDLEAAWGKQAEQSCQRSHQTQANQT
jgi:hypothetical protein